MTNISKIQPDDSKLSGYLKSLVRLFWMAGGYIILVLLIYSILFQKSKPAPDIAYLFVVLLMIGFRYIDVKKFSGTTMKGNPVTISHWKEYTIRLLLFSGLAYFISKVVNL